MDTADDGPEWLTRAQVAAALQVHVVTVSRWISTDPQMRVRRLGPNGHRVRIHRSEVERRLTVPTPQQDTTATA
ncbi:MULTISPECIES: helix-turn-helix domain-containing protein [unclassified Streptomyces]|uniref:helix-turn-helix domain-containing protein n=1 Tax=unclassified Streptomyces TaxID=2593676 RepID=UPI00225A8EC6|nr:MULTISPECIES: helix-turn-helix domain-containing protein [unclassified Streptomyces]WSP54469.1 helix-turn-helix domain-containing protein [Streptomyces sp. NBC_01241]WSU24855.1 helix-turn-helix domain-containing protein [Streptomyces sp. NBC_01108]MCX4786003.1 helix-turn-helix domain-containing protein [Streptomyces sp. NBC_01221]MCX4798140.1 helix-turn-helix domain-containing protein [Streptomyces sp. NBC_01242]WSJ39389.1 helix-turn-helix domain-containing protein [Streptomyces sp. NBC_013